MKSFFGKLFGKAQKPPLIQARKHAVPRDERRREERELYKKGDVIDGKYEVHGTLGKGGFGIVYLVRLRHTVDFFALKTFRDGFLADPAAQAAFKKEALLWVNLDAHPFILAAEWVDGISGRLFVSMEPVAPDAQGRVSLADHLEHANGPLATNLTLRWAIQFCLGMEHAKSRGLECHRDIKPDNILIAKDGVLKISDFGLATAAEAAWRGSTDHGASLMTVGEGGGFGFSLMQHNGKVRCGTPGYIAPEVYRYEGATIRSDIYSFGLVLWQMASGSRVPPFTVPWRGDMECYLRGIYEQQMTGRRLRADGPIRSVIERCLRPKPLERYSSFRELREELEAIWEKTTGKRFEIPKIGERSADYWSRKGASLHTLGRQAEMMRCFDKALVIDPQHAAAWNNKGNALSSLGRNEEAIQCYDKALGIAPQHDFAWSNKGTSLKALGRNEEAIGCYDEALAIDPRNARAWSDKGVALDELGRHEAAIGCYDQVLTITPNDVIACCNKGAALDDLCRREEAIGCYKKALAIAPGHTAAWHNMGNTLSQIHRQEEAIECYKRALAIDPGLVSAWYGKALAEDHLRLWRDALTSFRKFIELAPPESSQEIAHAQRRIHELVSKRA